MFKIKKTEKGLVLFVPSKKETLYYFNGYEKKLFDVMNVYYTIQDDEKLEKELEKILTKRGE